MISCMTYDLAPLLMVNPTAFLPDLPLTVVALSSHATYYATVTPLDTILTRMHLRNIIIQRLSLSNSWLVPADTR